MATFRTASRVRDTSTTTGTGNFTVSGSPPSSFIGFGSIPSIAVNDTFWYCIAHQTANEYEVGLGTWQGSNVFARTTILSSSNAGSAVNFSAGTKDCFLTLPATKFIPGDSYAILQDQETTATNGASPTGGGTWDTRVINTKVADPEGLITLSSNQFTPGADGVVSWYALAYKSAAHQSRLYNVTDSAVVGYGSSAYSYTSTGVTPTASVGSEPVVAGKAYRIEHTVGNATSALYGSLTGFTGNNEMYLEVVYRRTV